MIQLPLGTSVEYTVWRRKFNMETTGIKGAVFVVTLVFLYDSARGDTKVTCVLMETCILPCEFQPGNETVIHWIHETAGGTYAHSYYYDKDQFQTQGQRFRNRTSLFKEQISRGNASLQLTRVEIRDQGRYKCHASILDEQKPATSKFIILKVEDAAPAPVTPTSVLLSSTQLVKEDKKPDDSNNEHNDITIIGVVSGILLLAVIGGVTGYCLYRHNICCSSESLQNPPAGTELEALGGGGQRANNGPNGEADPLNQE